MRVGWAQLVLHFLGGNMRIHEQRTSRRLIAALAGLSLLATACGSSEGDAANDSSPVATTGETAAPDAASTTDAVDDTATTTEGDVGTSVDGDSTVDGSSGLPQKVVSLSPTATEIMFAIGAGDVLVAVDDFSNYPAEALELPNELSGFEPDIEAIAAYEPDLVLIGGDSTMLGDRLAELGIASWDGPAAATFDDTYAQIEQLGAATGHVGEAAELVLSMQTRIDELAAAAPKSEVPLTYFHELDDSLYSATSSTFIGEVYGLFGLVNVADALEADAGQYPQLTAEFLVEASPDLVFLADTKCCAETADTFGARDGFNTIAAVQNGNVVEMDDDIVSRWGPRVVDFIEAVAVAVEQAAVPV
jgi:iron complex transport system substrate-binding protein